MPDTKKPIVVPMNHPLHDTSVDDIIDWIRAHNEDGNIAKLSVVFEDIDGATYSNSINLKNKDYAYFLMQELTSLFLEK